MRAGKLGREGEKYRKRWAQYLVVTYVTLQIRDAVRFLWFHMDVEPFHGAGADINPVFEFFKTVSLIGIYHQLCWYVQLF